MKFFLRRFNSPAT